MIPDRVEDIAARAYNGEEVTEGERIEVARFLVDLMNKPENQKSWMDLLWAAYTVKYVKDLLTFDESLDRWSASC